MTANTRSIDYRILNGVDGFLQKENFDRISEWQAGLWERLQDEVRCESGFQFCFDRRYDLSIEDIGRGDLPTFVAWKVKKRLQKKAET